MSNDKPSKPSKTQVGYSLGRDQGFADTLPSVKLTKPSDASAARRIVESEELMTSAPVSSIAATSETSGAVTLSGARVSESLARELIVRRMAAKGITLQSDYSFRHHDLLVILDGFDPERNVGYQFISHADDDVVTDFDATAERRLRELHDQGHVQILIIHDYEAPENDAVLARVDAFLSEL